MLKLKGFGAVPHMPGASPNTSGESSRQHKSTLGFYSCVSGLVSHATALQLSDDPCSKEKNTLQYSLGMKSPEKIRLLCHVAFTQFIPGTTGIVSSIFNISFWQVLCSKTAGRNPTCITLKAPPIQHLFVVPLLIPSPTLHVLCSQYSVH